MSDASSVTQVRKDGQVVASFQYDSEKPAEDKAFEWLIDHQGQSVSYAIKHGGYSVVEVHANGNEEVLKWKL